MSGVNVEEELFEDITLFGQPMLFTCARCDRKTLPSGMYMYEIRHDDGCKGVPCEIAPWILVNHWGTVVSNKPVVFDDFSVSGKPFRLIGDEDWNYEGTARNIGEYMRENPPTAGKSKSEYER